MVEQGESNFQQRVTQQEQYTTLAEMLFPIGDTQKKLELERFRLDYESKHGETDLTLRYTCLWPTKQQDWMFRHEPARYFQGLPPFVQGYIRHNMEKASLSGSFAGLDETYIRLFLEGRMQLADKSAKDR